MFQYGHLPQCIRWILPLGDWSPTISIWSKLAFLVVHGENWVWRAVWKPEAAVGVEANVGTELSLFARPWIPGTHSTQTQQNSSQSGLALGLAVSRGRPITQRRLASVHSLQA